MNELQELVEGLDRINVLCDNVLVKLNGNEKEVKRIPVVIMSKSGHSCGSPETCRLNTTFNPWACMIENDHSELEIE
jgi:hypothetical protein